MGLRIKKIHTNVKKEQHNLLLFIHGLGASHRTWKSNKTDWFKLIIEDSKMSNFDIATVHYDTAHINSNILSKLRLKKIPLIKQTLEIGKRNEQVGIDILIQELKRELERVDIKSYLNIYIIGHSMGGLIGLGYLLKELEHGSNHSIKGFISLATPYNGSAAAAINVLIKKLHPHDQLRDLVSNSSFLDQINRLSIRFQDTLKSICSFGFGINDEIVPMQSAIPHFMTESTWSSGVSLPGSHGEVVEVDNDQHPTYVYVRDQILKWDAKIEISVDFNPNIINNFFPISSNFHGRDSELKEIQTILSKDGKVFITGMAGIGKTQLAVYYLNNFKYQYETICWIRAESHSLMMNDLQNFWQEINKKNDKEIYDELLLLGYIRNWMEQNSNYLFIFDNVKSENKFLFFLPIIMKGHIIITQQNSLIEIGHSRSQLPLNKLSTEDSLNLLFNLTEYDKDEYTLKIIEYFGGLPLSIEHVGVFIYQSNRTYEQVYNLLLDQPVDIKKRIGSTVSTNSSFENLINIILQELTNEHPEILNFLILLSFLAPDSICLEWFWNQKEIPSLISIFNNQLLFEDIRIGLLKYSLITHNKEKNITSIHRLLQLTIRERLSIEEKNIWHKQITNIFNRLMQTSINNSAEFRKKADFVDHIHALIEYYEKNTEDIQFLILIENTGIYLNEIARYTEAIPLFKYVLEKYDQKIINNQIDKVVIYSNLALALKNQNLYQEASNYYNQALNIFELENHTQTKEFASCLMNSGRLDMDLGNYDQSYKKIFTSFQLAEQLLPKNDISLAHFMNNYGLILQKLNRKKAYLYFIKALKLLKKEIKTNTTVAAVLYHNLSIEFIKRQKPKWAILSLEKSLQIDITYYGKKHPVLAYRYASLSDIYLSMEDYHLAVQNLKIAYKIRRKYFNLEHPNIGILFLKYGYVLIGKREIEKAKKWVIRSLNIDEKFYNDPSHVELEPALNTLIKIQINLVNNLLNQKIKDIEYLKQLCKDGKRYIRRSLKINYSGENEVYLDFFKSLEHNIHKKKIDNLSGQKHVKHIFIEFQDNGKITIKFLD